LRPVFIGCFAAAAALTALASRHAGAMVITEVQYNPGAANGGDDLEFVEIYNDAPTVVDLSGCSFSHGIDFVFPPNTFLKAHRAANVARSRRDSRPGETSAELDNGGRP
jgi:hypothetical protein